MGIKAILLSLFLIMTPIMVKQETLILLLDMSDSMSSYSLTVQFTAYANVLDDMRGKLRNTRIIAVAFGRHPVLISDGNVGNAVDVFTYLSDPENRSTFVIDRSGTCIMSAMKSVEKLVPSMQHPIVMDISGDGLENCENGIRDLSRKFLYDYGIIINSLPIAGQDSPLFKFYDEQVTTGLTIPALTIDNFEKALYVKLNLEIAMLGIK